MANNPYVNKVVYGNDVVMDITDTTAEAADVASGKKFYDRSGAPTLGTGTGGNVEWGDIGGTLSDQADLQAALDEKSNSIELTPSEYDILPTDEKEDPSKIYFIHEDSTWSGLTSFVGNNTWTDGTNIYYSNGSSKQYVLDKATSTWNPKTWNGLTDIYKDNIWTDGTDVYYSNGNGANYVLDKSTSTWETKTWSGYSSIEGKDIWTDGTSIYYSGGSSQYVLDKATSTWIAKTWNNYNIFYGRNIWTDGTNVYLSSDISQYVLSIATSTWNPKTWNGITRFYATNIWTDGTDIFYSVGSAQYVLDKSTSTWVAKTWSGLTEFYASYVWTDGTSIYYSYGTSQYRLDGIEWTTDINANDCDLIRYKNRKYGEKTEINDTDTASDKVWSSEKVSDELDDKTDNSVVGTVESGATASKAYAVGEHFIRDGAFCTAIAAIAQDAAFTLNTNYTAGDIAEAILADQTFNWNSVKAQSGKAVNEAFLTKFDYFNMSANRTYTITFTGAFVGLLCMSHTSAGRMDIFFVRATETITPVVLHLSSGASYTVTTGTATLNISHGSGTIRTDILAFQGMGNYTITSVANS